VRKNNFLNNILIIVDHDAQQLFAEMLWETMNSMLKFLFDTVAEMAKLPSVMAI